MIDAEARFRARQLVRKIMSEDLHPDDVEVNWPETADLAVRSIRYWLWTLYDDDSYEVVHFKDDSSERTILTNVEAFLGTSQVFEPLRLGVLAQLKDLLIAGVEWRGCELPWHEQWPFPPTVSRDQRSP